MENREAIEWLKGCVVSYEVDNKGKPNGNITCDLTQEVLDMAISALEKQEQDGWIPVAERLPEDYSDVLVWFEYFRYGSYNRLYQTYGIGNYSAQYDAWTVNHETGWNKLRVIAWRPLPEPYTEEES